MTDRYTECAAIERKNGLFRLIKVVCDRTAAVGTFDYYHAAFELDGRWNAEFYDEKGHTIWARGSEDTLDFEWDLHAVGHPETNPGSLLRNAIHVSVSDVKFDDVPTGALCQTVDERANGIPRHWKKWRIV